MKKLSFSGPRPDWSGGAAPVWDRQQDRPQRLCPVCGQEQYRYDPPGLWRGRRVCAACLSRLTRDYEEEEEASI